MQSRSQRSQSTRARPQRNWKNWSSLRRAQVSARMVIVRVRLEETSMLRKLLYLLPALVAVNALSQDIQVNRQNKTIAVTADESISADAEVAVLAIGYRNYRASQDAAFHENVRAAERITKAILDAKIPEANIETEKLSLGP